MGIAILIFYLSTAVAVPQHLAVDVEQILWWSLTSRHDEMGMRGHTVTPLVRVKLYFELSVVALVS